MGILAFGIFLLTGGTAAGTSETQTLGKAELAAVKELADRFVDAINRKDIDSTMACVWNSPDMILVSFGNVARGCDGFRSSLEQMFAQNETINLVVNDISCVPVGNMVMAVGTATFDLQPKNGQSMRIVERWTDLERRVDGRWVYVLDHTT